MSVFVVSLRLPGFYDEEFISLIPSHRQLVNQLLSVHIMEAYAISAARDRGWITLNAEDATAAQSIVRQLPLYKYFSEVRIDELFIFDRAPGRFPAISLN